MIRIFILIGLLAGPFAFADGILQPGFSIVAGGTPSPSLVQLTDLGPADPTLSIALVLALNSKDPAGFAAYANEITDPGSPNYRKFLSPTQFCEKFGSDPNATALATSYFATKGIALTLNEGCTFLTGTATMAQINDAFLTKMEAYNIPTDPGKPTFMLVTYATALLLPSTFADSVSEVLRLTQEIPTTPAP